MRAGCRGVFKISSKCFLLAWFDFPLLIRVWAEWGRLGVFGREGEEGGVRSGPGEARTILLLHIISIVYMELGS